MSAKAIPALFSIPEGTVLERLTRSVPSVVAGLGLAGAGRSARPRVSSPTNALEHPYPYLPMYP